uniref:Lipocalin/cytosolic fatty-acid binding domain-containing protein n=1 Tax=Clastoptera arizonana TaxID=38151 RepID=A0A1B6CEC3_9HEMI
MQSFTLIIFSFCFGVFVYSDPQPGCKQIEGISKFDFNSYVGKQYKVEYAPAVKPVKGIKAITHTLIEVEKTWYVVVTINEKDGSQRSEYLRIDNHEGPEIFFTPLQDGQPTDIHRQYTVIGYKPFRYIQFYLCGQDLSEKFDIDLRFYLSFRDIKLSKREYKEILHNDKQHNFTGGIINLIKSGRQGNLLTLLDSVEKVGDDVDQIS